MIFAFIYWPLVNNEHLTASDTNRLDMSKTHKSLGATCFPSNLQTPIQNILYTNVPQNKDPLF